jgi:mono/diheme cytochrome c family protein
MEFVRDRFSVTALLLLLAASAMILLSAARAQDGAAPVQDGAYLYKESCAACHMLDGMGAEGAGRYPNLAGNPVVEASADFVLLRILRGQGAMPPFASSLNDEKIASIVNYVRGTFNSSTDEIGAPDVARLR